MKSSSALACAAIRALDKASWTGLSDSEIVDLAVEAQTISGCSITGSMDDTWAAMSPGWKVVDPSVPSAESILFEGELETGLTVMIGLRGRRKFIPDKEFLESQLKQFCDLVLIREFTRCDRLRDEV